MVKATTPSTDETRLSSDITPLRSEHRRKIGSDAHGAVAVSAVFAVGTKGRNSFYKINFSLRGGGKTRRGILSARFLQWPVRPFGSPSTTYRLATRIPSICQSTHVTCPQPAPRLVLRPISSGHRLPPIGICTPIHSFRSAPAFSAVFFRCISSASRLPIRTAGKRRFSVFSWRARRSCIWSAALNAGKLHHRV